MPNEPDRDPSSPDHPWSRPPFIPGLELSRRFYAEAVAPILEREFPPLPHSAALIGYGSDVLGFDDPRSRDHMWGPRLVLFLPEEGFAELRDRVDATLRRGLPRTFLGYSTHFSPPDPQDNGTRVLAETEEDPIDHLIELATLPAYFEKELGWDTRRALTAADWLTFSEQRLLSLTAGGVWRDDLGLGVARAALAYYPEPVWRYLLACQWAQIGQEEQFVGRTAEAGDELGSRLMAAKMARCLMRLAFLMERRYAPYSKWFGTGFRRLAIAGALVPCLAEALAAADYPARERALCAAYVLCARCFNALGLVPPLPEEPTWFFSRPFKVIHGGDFATALVESIADPEVLFLARHSGLVGSVNQFSDSTDLLESLTVLGRMRELFTAPI